MSDPVMTVYRGRNEHGLVRLGIAAGKRLGNAVARNRVKRLIRESFRRHRTELPAGSDWVVVPRRAGIMFREIEESLLQLSSRLAAVSPRG